MALKLLVFTALPPSTTDACSGIKYHRLGHAALSSCAQLAVKLTGFVYFPLPSRFLQNEKIHQPCNAPRPFVDGEMFQGHHEWQGVPCLITVVSTTHCAPLSPSPCYPQLVLKLLRKRAAAFYDSPSLTHEDKPRENGNPLLNTPSECLLPESSGKTYSLGTETPPPSKGHEDT